MLWSSIVGGGRHLCRWSYSFGRVKTCHKNSRLPSRNMSATSPDSQHVNNLISVASKLLDPAMKSGADYEQRVLDTKSLETCIAEYNSLPPKSDCKRRFFHHLCKNYGVDQTSILRQCEALAHCVNSKRGNGPLLKAQHRLKKLLLPKYCGLFTQLGTLEDGVKFLIDLRHDAMSEARSGADDGNLMQFSEHLGDILRTWFAVGLLQLERITWDTSADILEKVGKYEAVHTVRGWMDLKHRLGPCRRCYAFFHGNMPREPVIVLHVALTDEISDNVTDILEYGVDAKGTTEGNTGPECAVFYSITSTQKGLQGIELGTYLIQAVVDRLQKEQPQLSKFSSLSPIPGFRKWLSGEVESGQVLKHLDPTYASSLENELRGLDVDITLYQLLRGVVAEKRIGTSFLSNPVLKSLLVTLCGTYICRIKRRGYALDPVANFHLKNGAVVWRINWAADTSLSGINQSLGMMVNYRYYLNAMARNSYVYTEDKVISISDAIRQKMLSCGSKVQDVSNEFCGV